jgi:hypothetical protein
VREYQIGVATCEEDLLAFLEQLAARGLIRVTDAQAP